MSRVMCQSGAAKSKPARSRCTETVATRNWRRQAELRSDQFAVQPLRYRVRERPVVRKISRMLYFSRRCRRRIHSIQSLGLHQPVDDCFADLSSSDRLPGSGRQRQFAIARCRRSPSDMSGSAFATRE